jgi:hypothetical protein
MPDPVSAKPNKQNITAATISDRIIHRLVEIITWLRKGQIQDALLVRQLHQLAEEISLEMMRNVLVFIF